MRITASRRDDIIRQRDEYDARARDQKARHDEQYGRFQRAQYDKTQPVQEKLENDLSKFSALHFNVQVDPWGRYGTDKMAIRIECNENEKFSDSSALSWNYQAYVAKGQVVRETSSWSGLKAVTSDQMESLRQTLQALEYLNSLDWEAIINIDMPRYSDYVTENGPDIRDRPDFDKMLMEVDLEEIVGKPKAVRVNNWESSPYRGDYVWVQLIKETPMQYTGRICGDYNKEEVANWLRRAIDQNYATYRIRKSTIDPVTPLQIVEASPTV